MTKTEAKELRAFIVKATAPRGAGGRRLQRRWAVTAASEEEAISLLVADYGPHQFEGDTMTAEAMPGRVVSLVSLKV